MRRFCVVELRRLDGPAKLAPERALGVGAVSLSRIHSESAFGPSLSSTLPRVSLTRGRGAGRREDEPGKYTCRICGEGDGVLLDAIASCISYQRGGFP